MEVAGGGRNLPENLYSAIGLLGGVDDDNILLEGFNAWGAESSNGFGGCDVIDGIVFLKSGESCDGFGDDDVDDEKRLL